MQAFQNPSERVTMDQIMKNVGLSESLKNRVVDNVVINALPVKVVERKKPQYMNSPEMLGSRNPKLRNALMQNSADNHGASEPSINTNYHKMLIQRIQDEKFQRKKREELRRRKSLEKYTKLTEEKQKVEQEERDKINDEKVIRHKATLVKIQKQGEDRKAQIAESGKLFREVSKGKPLYKKVEERYQQEVESQELATIKKALENKRNFVNQVPAGGFKKAFGEHEINYKQMKDEREAKIAQKRVEEKNKLKNHYGALKFKPKKPEPLIGINTGSMELSRQVNQLAV